MLRRKGRAPDSSIEWKNVATGPPGDHRARGPRWQCDRREPRAVALGGRGGRMASHGAEQRPDPGQRRCLSGTGHGPPSSTGGSSCRVILRVASGCFSSTVRTGDPIASASWRPSMTRSPSSKKRALASSRHRPTLARRPSSRRPKIGARFPIGYGLPLHETARTLTAFYEDRRGIFHATGFVTKPDQTIGVACYSTAQIGRLVVPGRARCGAFLAALTPSCGAPRGLGRSGHGSGDSRRNGRVWGNSARQWTRRIDRATLASSSSDGS